MHTAQSDAEHYRACLALAQSKPADGLEEARAWISAGGGEPAQHCAAMALIGLKHYAEAARGLEHLADKSTDTPTMRAAMLAQAGQVWLLVNNTGQAYTDQTEALRLTPDAPELLIDRAETAALAQNYRAALADLDQVLSAQPQRIDALVYRASARRLTGDLDGAAADAATVLKLDPKNQDAWLESGNVKRLKGDLAGARADWLRAVELSPQSDAAADARANIERLDVKE
jgi:tetratricopeptide (TPR) repeat protein